MRLAILQVRPGTPIARLQRLIAAHPADLHALPEYLTARVEDRLPADVARHLEADVRRLTDLSRGIPGTLLVGSLVERQGGTLRNTSLVLRGGDVMGVHRKVHPTLRERRNLIRGAGTFDTVEVAGLRIATLICADVLAGDAFRQAATGRPDLVFVPATSPARPAESPADKWHRDRTIFSRGAREAGAFVAKACAAGRVFGGALQGRSLVAAPWGALLARVPAEREPDDLVLTADLDLQRLRAWRRSRIPAPGPGGRACSS